MEDYKNRLIAEESDLNKRIENLYDFSQSENMDMLSSEQKALLLIQLEAMRTYWRCLVARNNLATN